MQHRPSPARFKLRPGETLLGRAEVVADTPALAGVAAMVWVTERRVVLCRAPGRLLLLATLAAVAATIAVGQVDETLGGLFTLSAVLLVVGRTLLRFRRIIAEAQGGEVADVTRSEAAIGVFLRDGSTWRLRPARQMVVVPGPLSRNRFATAGLASVRLVGRAGHVPVQRAARA